MYNLTEHVLNMTLKAHPREYNYNFRLSVITMSCYLSFRGRKNGLWHIFIIINIYPRCNSSWQLLEYLEHTSTRTTWTRKYCVPLIWDWIMIWKLKYSSKAIFSSKFMANPTWMYQHVSSHLQTLLLQFHKCCIKLVRYCDRRLSGFRKRAKKNASTSVGLSVNQYQRLNRWTYLLKIWYGRFLLNVVTKFRFLAIFIYNNAWFT